MLMEKTVKLGSYIGKPWNDITKQSIENDFKPFKIMVCDDDYFCCEVFIENVIRCVLKNGVISDLAFN